MIAGMGLIIGKEERGRKAGKISKAEDRGQNGTRQGLEGACTRNTGSEGPFQDRRRSTKGAGREQIFEKSILEK